MISTLTLADFADLHSNSPQGTSLTGPHHMAGTASVWTLDTAESRRAVIVISGSEVVRIDL